MQHFLHKHKINLFELSYHCKNYKPWKKSTSTCATTTQLLSTVAFKHQSNSQHAWYWTRDFSSQVIQLPNLVVSSPYIQLTLTIYRLFQEKNYTDCIITAGKNSTPIYVHRAIVSNGSDLLDKLCKKDFENPHDRPLHFPNIGAVEMEVLLSYVYTLQLQDEYLHKVCLYSLHAKVSL